MGCQNRDLKMELSEEQLKILLKLVETKPKSSLTLEEVQRFIQLDTIDDCKEYLCVMLDFFFEVFKSPEGRKATSSLEDERNIWLQTIFSKSCHFLYLLDGVGYNNGSNHLNPIIDPSILFTIARRIYESVIAFELLFVIPRTEDEKTTRREIPKALMGKSVMKPEDLSKTLEEIQENITNALDALKELKTRELNIKKEFSELDSKYAEFVGWANQFETASLEVQRMIVNKMVKEISIGKGIDGEYEVKILLRGTYNQFINPEYAVA